MHRNDIATVGADSSVGLPTPPVGTFPLPGPSPVVGDRFVWEPGSVPVSACVSHAEPAAGGLTHTSTCALGSGRPHPGLGPVGRAPSAGRGRWRSQLAVVPDGSAEDFSSRGFTGPAGDGVPRRNGLGETWTSPMVWDARPGALEAARAFLRGSGDADAARFAEEGDAELLRWLGVTTPDGQLTPTGILAFIGRGQPCLEYVRRTHPGADSVIRLRWTDRSLLEELAEVLDTINADDAPTSYPPAAHVNRAKPRRAAMEAIVNGVAHRDWSIQEPTLVEHIGQALRVTSPGGFIDGITETNVMTHPSRSRNRELTDLFVALRLANREGIGIDRIIGDVVRRGNSQPQILQIEGPAVQVSIVCERPDQAWVAWLRKVDQSEEADDLNSLLLLRHLVDVGWLDLAHAALRIQDTRVNARRALSNLVDVTMEGENLLVEIPGIPDPGDPVWVLSSAALDFLARMDHGFGQPSRTISREGTARDYLMGRGRISATELAAVVRATDENVQPVLKRLEREGVMVPMCPDRWGRASHYVPAPARGAWPLAQPTGGTPMPSVAHPGFRWM